jgi:hypothetical protein
MGLLGALPGPAGLAGKAVNAGINASNTKATNIAREQMGLEKVSMARALGNLISDQKGKVADVKIGPNDYAIGLEAQSKVGKTTMTPDEANKRAFANQTNIVEMTPAESKASNTAFKEEYGGGWFSKAKQEVSNIFESFFGGEEPKEQTQEEKISHLDSLDSQTLDALNARGLQAAKDANPSGDTSKFADKPDSPQGGDKGWGDMSDKERSDARGMSGEVADSIERGDAGLY